MDQLVVIINNKYPNVKVLCKTYAHARAEVVIKMISTSSQSVWEISK